VKFERTASFDSDWRRLAETDRKLFRDQVRAFHDAAEQQVAPAGFSLAQTATRQSRHQRPRHMGNDLVILGSGRSRNVRVDRNRWRTRDQMAPHRRPQVFSSDPDTQPDPNMVETHISDEPLRLTVVYEEAGDGWVMASIPDVPGVLTQGATMEHARVMIQSALRDWLEYHIQDQHEKLPAVPEGNP
jgi:predicted RNase H-like HicB family nuclease